MTARNALPGDARVGRDLDGAALAQLLARQHQTKEELLSASESAGAAAASASAPKYASTQTMSSADPSGTCTSLPNEVRTRAERALLRRLAALLRACLALSVRVVILEDLNAVKSNRSLSEMADTPSTCNLAAALAASAKASSKGASASMAISPETNQPLGGSQGEQLSSPAVQPSLSEVSPLTPGTTSEATRSAMPPVLQLPSGLSLQHQALSAATLATGTENQVRGLMPVETVVPFEPSGPLMDGDLPSSCRTAPDGTGLQLGDLMLELQADSSTTRGSDSEACTLPQPGQPRSASHEDNLLHDGNSFDSIQSTTADGSADSPAIFSEAFIRRLVAECSHTGAISTLEPPVLSEAIESIVNTLRLSPRYDTPSSTPRQWAEWATSLLAALSAEVWPRWLCLLDLALLYPDAQLSQLGIDHVRAAARRFGESVFRETLMLEQRAYLRPDQRGITTTAMASALRASSYYQTLSPPSIRDVSWHATQQPVFFEQRYAARAGALPKQGCEPNLGLSWTNWPQSIPHATQTPKAIVAPNHDPSVTPSPASSPAGVHLIVFVHGFHGNSYDLRTMRDQLALILPHKNKMRFLCSASNEEHTANASFETLGGNLAKEITDFMRTENIVQVCRRI